MLKIFLLEAVNAADATTWDISAVSVQRLLHASYELCHLAHFTFLVMLMPASPVPHTLLESVLESGLIKHWLHWHLGIGNL